MNRTISLNMVEPSTYFVKGNLTFSRLTSQIAGDELEKDKRRREAKGFIPIERPYTTATIHNAEIMRVNPDRKTNAEIYGEESFYRNAKQSGYSFTGNNKGKSLPWIGTSKDGGKTIDQIVPEGELAGNLNVILVMRVFKGKMNNGQSLDGVIVLEPIKYYENNTQNLAQYGITFNSCPSPAEKPVAQPAAESPIATPFSTEPTATNTPFASAPSAFGQSGIQYKPE